MLSSINDKYLGDELYVWKPIKNLVDASGKERMIQLYIKTSIDNNQKLVVIISFHEYKDYGGD